MYLMITVATLMTAFAMMMTMVAMTTSKKTFKDREKSSPFECGFDPKSSPRLPFSLQFFLIAMMFLIFDIEITLLLPLIMSYKIINMTSLIMITTIFLMTLIIGLYHEWNQGALDWEN